MKSVEDVFHKGLRGAFLIIRARAELGAQNLTPLFLRFLHDRVRNGRFAPQRPPSVDYKNVGVRDRFGQSLSLAHTFKAGGHLEIGLLR